MTPKTAALAYQIWAYANPRGWDCTVREVADHLGISAQTVGIVAQHRDWTGRFRSNGSQEERFARRNSSRALGMTEGYMTRINAAEYRGHAGSEE